jgi:PAS domain S-box-containing protein
MNQDINRTSINIEHESLKSLLNNNRLELEKEILLSYERYRLIQKAGNVGGWEFDIKTGEYWQTNQFLKMFGIDYDSKNKSTEIEACVIDNAKLLQLRSELIEQNKPYNTVFDINRHDNKERRTLHAIAELSFDENGKPDRVIGVTLDITDEQNQLRQLKQTEAEIKAVFEHEKYNIWSINTAYEISYVNKKFADEFEYYFGIRLKRGVNIYNAIPSPIKEIWRKRYDRVLANEAFLFEEQVPFGDGFIYVEVSASPIIVDGNVIGASFFGLDITERKTHEIKLLKAKEQLQQLLELSSEFIRKSENQIDYQQLGDIIKGIAGAKYAIYNSYENNGTICITKAVSGKGKWLEIAEKVFNTNILNGIWTVEPHLGNILKKRMTNKFDRLLDLTGNSVYKIGLKQIQEFINIGSIYSVSIFSNQELVGNLYLFFEKSKDIQNIELCELFANHIGEYLGRKISENKLSQKMEEMERFQRLTVGRELTMIELKKEVNELRLQLGLEEKYKIVGL